MTTSVRVIAALAGVEIEVIKVEKEGMEDYKKNICPTGLFPYLQIDQDNGIYESTAIARYLAKSNPESKLYGSTVFQSALVDAELDRINEFHIRIVAPALYPIFGWGAPTEDAWKAASKNFKDGLKTLSNDIGDKKFLVGDSLTIADIIQCAWLNSAFATMIDQGFGKHQVSNLVKYWTGIVATPEYVKFYGAVKQTKKPFKPVFPKKEPKKKVEAQKPKKKEEKAKNPLDCLPKSKLEINDFKLWFINHPDKKAAMTEFFETRFDNEGWSLWFLEYEKFGKEGQIEYMFGNLLEGLVARAEALARYAFGRLNMIGDEPNLDIHGVWMWRGLEYPQELKDHPQFEYVKCTKLDVTNEDDRKKVYNHWTSVEGEPFEDGTMVRRMKYMR